ncbi:MAG: hypothetical protein WC428_02165 [Candidatus Paceibacterota bacterium]|jgi:hypothetical protein
MKNLVSLVSPILAFVVMICSVSFIIAIASPFLTEKDMKKYVLAHKDMIKKEGNILKIPSTDFKYYTDITLRLLDTNDSTYQIVFWGDRDSKLWDFKLDKPITVTIPYNRYKNKNVNLDVKVFELINNFK